MEEMPDEQESLQREAGPESVLDARELFHGRKEIVIDHEGVQYRLRITRRNKLILQK